MNGHIDTPYVPTDNNHVASDEIGQDMLDDDGLPPRLDQRAKQRRTLSAFDVAALIANKMIGTGIFTTPATVLRNTLDKNVAIGLWTLGFFYTVLSMLLYIEYARKLPFTGGELVYMDDAMPKPRLLAYTLYAFYFVFLYTSATNCMQFARFVLASANYEYFSTMDDDKLDHNQRLVRFLSVAVISAICLLLYVSSAKSKLVNKATALAKVILLLGVILAGAAYIGKNGLHGLRRSTPDIRDLSSRDTNWPFALMQALFSFHGWENATMVAGEIDSFRVLRKGFLWAVCGVGAIYLSVAILLAAAFDWSNTSIEAAKDSVPGNYLALYLGGGNSANIASAILISLSAFGSLLSVTYTCIRVKQSIAWANLLPCSHIWRQSGPVHPQYRWQQIGNKQELVMTFSEKALDRPGTPQGGIILHWIMTVFYICVTAAYTHISDAISFAGNLLVYGHFWAEAAVALLFIPIGAWGFRPGPILRSMAHEWHMDRDDRDKTSEPASWFRPKFAPWTGPLILGSLIAAFSIAIIVAAVVKNSQTLLYVTMGVLGAGICYWILFVNVETSGTIYHALGFQIVAQTHGIDDFNDPDRVCHWCAEVDGEHRHPVESYSSYNVISLKDREGLRARVLHRLFDGRSWN
ncbi:hypothetical protein AC578_601 [Pseudocercospora eumusae]|uniref:Amino acid permease/ SLC12A domain-containing protein n=1 Tax=Pseudocercospora eumusae TaxID=321146 RepID=A0A139HFM7_9PEZI|nr:hypothetical protein AC578_601 [Pseudocercospora eumusae]